VPAHINLDKVSLHNGIIRQTSRRMRRHSHNNCVSWQKKKNRKYIYLCAYGHKTQCQMHKNSLHFITCSIVAVCMRINACARWRCYTTTHFMSERKTSKDPLEKKKLDVSKNPICTDKTRTTTLLVIDSYKVRGLMDEKETNR